MSRKTNDRKSKIKLISDTMTGFYSVMRNLKEDYKTYSKNYSEEALALLSKSDDFIESVEAVRSRDSLSSIDDDGINNLFLLSQQISELYHLKVQTKIEDEKPKTLPKKIKSEKTFWNTLWGALQGEFNEDPTGTQILIDMGINFIPGVGQVCDARDIAACLKKLVIEKRVDEIMIWVTLLLTAIGCVPYAGDVIKAGCKAILKGADDVVLKILRKLDADDVQKAVKILKTKFTSSIDDAIAMVNKWIEKAGNSKYGNRIKGILSSANENLNKAVDFVKKQIDEFEKRIFGENSKIKPKTNKSKTIKIENAAQMSVPQSEKAALRETAKEDLNSSLLKELAHSNVKYNPDDVVTVIKNSDGKLIWLEKGNSKKGLIHILERHADDFASQGVDNIPKLLENVLSSKPINTGSNAKGLFADYMFKGNKYRVAYGTNGFVVSFYPID